MRLAIIIPSCAVVSLMAGGALAAEEPRYTIEKSETGYVRMDTRTGEMSICEERSGQLVCKLAADERSAFEGDIDRLQHKVTALEERVAALENSLAARFEKTLPTEEEFQKTMGYMERFFRSFIGIVKEFQQEEPAPDQSPGPNKT